MDRRNVEGVQGEIHGGNEMSYSEEQRDKKIIDALKDIASNLKQIKNSLTPQGDMVEVVRCEDCLYCEERHYEEEGEKPYIKLGCKWSNYSHQPNDYCSIGERRENAV